MRKMYHTVADAAHSWTKVPVSELVNLGIADKITSFSYRKGDMAYLEEDTDLSTFVEARKARGIDTNFKRIERQNCSRIRNYTSYDFSVEG